MPHLVLELSENVREKDGLVHLLSKSHAILAEGLSTDINGCKSRVVIHPIYCVGDGRAINAFVHLDLKIMAGRGQELREQIGNRLMELLRSHFATSRQQGNLQITLELSELARVYLKTSS